MYYNFSVLLAYFVLLAYYLWIILCMASCKCDFTFYRQNACIEIFCIAFDLVYDLLPCVSFEYFVC